MTTELLPPLSVLVVDDSEDTAHSTAELLALCGHAVRAATCGVDAVRAAVAEVPDVVLLDIGLPNLDGWQVAVHIRSRAGGKQPLVALEVSLPDNAEIGPVPVRGGRGPEAELERLSNILKTFNEQFGTLFKDSDRIVKRIRDHIAPKIAANEPHQNAKKNTPNAARIELDAALMRVMGPLLKDDTEFYKQFVQNESFRRFITDIVVNLTGP